jgi:hypothetical protein
MPATKHVYQFNLVVSQDARSNIHVDLKQFVEELRDKPVYTIRSYENGEIEFSPRPVGQVITVMTNEQTGATTALISLDSYINPKLFTIEPLFEKSSDDDTARLNRLVLRPESQPGFMYFVLDTEEYPRVEDMFSADTLDT